MTKLEQHRQTWQGKSDEWLFERLANELTQKVEEIHKLLAENEQLRLSNVVGQSEQLPKNNCTLNRQTCGKGSGCKYPHCHI